MAHRMSFHHLLGRDHRDRQQSDRRRFFAAALGSFHGTRAAVSVPVGHVLGATCARARASAPGRPYAAAQGFSCQLLGRAYSP